MKNDLNKKGFTLVEILVTIGLLAILGVGIGVSLNKVLKNQEENSYESFIEKIKSSTLLYISNSAQIANDLEHDYGYKLISMNDLINEGYIRGNLKNPNTNEEIKDVSQVDEVGKEDYSRARVYYTMDKEMVIEYPFIKPNEDIYLSVINYTTMYKTSETNLCYKGLNTSNLGLIDANGKVIQDNNIKLDLPDTKKSKNNIIAYMEDGSKCTDSVLNTSKVGTYKIRYVYTIDGSAALNNPNAKSATRNIVIKQTKPVIDIFEVAQTSNQGNVYQATMKLKASDVEGINLKFCLVATKESESSNIKDCKGNSENFQPNKWIAFQNNVNFEQDFNIQTYFKDLSESEAQIRFFIYVRNDFEEFTYSEKKNTNELGTKTYLLTSTLRLHFKTNSNLDNSSFYRSVDIEGTMGNNVNLDKDGILTIDKIKNVPNKKTFKQVLDNTEYKSTFHPLTKSYYFSGWYYDSEFKTSVINTDIIFGVVDVYAKWVEDTSNPSCTVNATSPLTVTENENIKLYVSGWYGNANATLSGGTHTYRVVDYAGNMGSCSINLVGKVSYPVYIPKSECRSGSCDCQDGNGWYIVGKTDANGVFTCTGCCRNYTDTEYRYKCPSSDYSALSNSNYCYKY